MAIVKYLVPAVVFVGSTLAQCSTSATLTVQAAGDASALASCTTYSGSVAVVTDVSIGGGNSNGQNALSIDGVEKITQNLTITGAPNLASISFGSLKSIGGFSLAGLTVLSSLSFPQLTIVDSLNFTALPALQQLSFGNTGITQAGSILISNTGLSSLSGISNLETVTTVNINNNVNLQNISLAITSIKGALAIEANDGYQSGLSTSFPQLQTAMNLTFRNCSSVMLPSLANVSQYLGFYGNTMQTFAAPNLTTTGGLVFVDNTALTNVSFPSLTAVNGSFQIANNTMLKQINSFPKLSTVTGGLDLNGNFTDVELPSLSQVNGAFNLQTSAQFDCSGFQKDQQNKVIKGKYTCSGAVAKPGGAGTNPSSTSSGSSSSKSSSADAVIIPPFPTLMGATSIFAWMLQLLL